jgi:cell division protein FtsB
MIVKNTRQFVELSTLTLDELIAEIAKENKELEKVNRRKQFLEDTVTHLKNELRYRL